MIKKLLRSVREYKKNIYVAAICVALESVFDIAIPTLMALVIDNGISRGDLPYVVRIGLMLTLIAALSLVAGTLAGRNGASAAVGFATNLRRDMFVNIQKFSFSNVDKFSTASIITRLTTDIMNVQNAFQMFMRFGLRSPLMIGFVLFFAFRTNSRLSLIFFLIIPVLGVGLWVIIMNVHPVFMRVFGTFDKLNRTVQENLHGIRVVKSYNRSSFEEKKFGEISQSIFSDFTRAEKRLAFNMPLMQFCLYACMLFLSWVGAKEIIASGNDAVYGFTTGGLVSLVSYSMQVLMSLIMLSNVFIMFIIARASAERIVEILEEESDLQSGSSLVSEVADGSITFENVSFSYSSKNDNPVLSGVNLSIKSGETVGILGGTGSSKSSLVQLIPRLYDVTEGRVTVGGVDVRDYDLEALRNQVAIVLQKNLLFSGTIKENLLWGDENASDEQLFHACSIAQADGFIREFPNGYDTYIEQGGTNVSGGQRQRLCIARALIKNPKIFIMDDSTSAVDTKTDNRIRQAFREELPHVTKIIIAQRVASVQDADKIIVMEDGRVDSVGSHSELMERCGIYREVYDSQNKGGAADE